LLFEEEEEEEEEEEDEEEEGASASAFSCNSMQPYSKTIRARTEMLRADKRILRNRCASSKGKKRKTKSEKREAKGDGNGRLTRGWWR
jgi:hypothetical protein